MSPKPHSAPSIEQRMEQGIEPDTMTATQKGWTFNTALQLGRVSNLPTVWTNTLAGLLLTGVFAMPSNLLLLLIAMSLAYTGGMYLNDAFDREFDAANRPERPIPSGEVCARDVFIAGFIMLMVAIVLATTVGGALSNGFAAALSTTALAGAIVSYNLWHKNNPLSPLLMGLCRLLVYVSCAVTIIGTLPTLLIIGAAVTFSYLIGLTYTAKQEQFGRVSTLWPLACLAAPVIFGIARSGSDTLTWICTASVCVWTLHCLRLIMRRQPGDIPKAVTGLIAGIALIDGLLIATAAVQYDYTQGSTLAMVAACWAAFALTLKLQRYISGT